MEFRILVRDGKVLQYFEDKLRFDYYQGLGGTDLAYPIKLITEAGASKSSGVDTTQISWNRIEEYIFKWYPVLDNRRVASFE